MEAPKSFAPVRARARDLGTPTVSCCLRFRGWRCGRDLGMSFLRDLPLRRGCSTCTPPKMVSVRPFLKVILSCSCAGFERPRADVFVLRSAMRCLNQAAASSCQVDPPYKSGYNSNNSVQPVCHHNRRSTRLSNRLFPFTNYSEPRRGTRR